MKTKKPTLLYDGDCDFCQYCVDYMKQKTNDKIIYQAYQDGTLGRPVQACKKSIQLVVSDTEFHQGAAAALKALNVNPYSHGWWLYQYVPGFAWVAEITYRWITRHRSFCFKIVKKLYGQL